MMFSFLLVLFCALVIPERTTEYCVQKNKAGWVIFIPFACPTLDLGVVVVPEPIDGHIAGRDNEDIGEVEHVHQQPQAARLPTY